MTATAPETGIADEARRLGFAAIGFAQAGASCSGPVLAQWLARGYAGGMDYLFRHAPLRRHPALLVPAVRTVIAVAARYPVNPQPGDGFCMTARTQDYHEVLRGKLRLLAAFIHCLTPLQCARICVDSAPLAEREWALRAGMGWQGRQGQLIIPGAGACTVLGFLLTDAVLTPSAPIGNRCGDCRLCVERCPTRAILPDGRVDARRCISYLTIEHRGDIHPELQAVMGRSLFGCDICTACCPWNRTATAPVMPELAPDAHPLPDAATMATLTPDAFATRFRGTAIKRSGLDRLRRNALIALRGTSTTDPASGETGISACQAPRASTTLSVHSPRRSITDV